MCVQFLVTALSETYLYSPNGVFVCVYSYGCAAFFELFIVQFVVLARRTILHAERITTAQLVSAQLS